MEKFALVFLGGGLGAMARYAVGVRAFKMFGPNWPYGTLLVNVSGGLLMGMLAGWLAHRGDGDQNRWRLLLGVGVLGGFTTFSAFSLEAALMINRRDYAQAFSYSASSVLLSVAALYLGLMISRRLFA